MNVVNSKKKVKIFFLYAKEDAEISGLFKHFLIPFEKLGRVEIEDGSQIISGVDWDLKMKEAFNQADLILLMISPDFITSDFCYQDDLRMALERHENKKAILLPILLKLTPYWKELMIGKLDYLPIDHKAISQWKDQEEALFDVAKYIKKVINKFSEKEIDYEEI